MPKRAFGFEGFEMKFKNNVCHVDTGERSRIIIHIEHKDLPQDTRMSEEVDKSRAKNS